MDILAPRYEDIPDPTATVSGRTLVVTDRPAVVAAAHALGVACWQTGPVTDVSELRDHDTVVVAWGSGGVPTPDQAREYAHACLALLRAVCAPGRRTHLVTLSDETDVLPSLMNGMATSAALEHSLSHTAIECHDPVTAERLQAWLAAAAQHPGARLKVAGGRVSLLRHTPETLPPPEAAFGAGDTVVLIGGAGGIGRALCQYLSERCGATLFVLGRGTPDGPALAALREAGVKSYLSVPAHEPAALDEALQHIHHGFGPITAVINLAGVLDDCLLHNLTPERLDGVLRPKVDVAIALAGLTGPHRPERVVHFSSLTAVTGNAGQIAYGGANAFLDRMSARLPDWHSINWGLWDTDGMRMPDGESGLRPMRPEQACDVLMSAIAAQTTRLVVFDGQVRLPGSAEETVTAASGDLSGGTREWLRALVTRHTGLKRLGDEDNLLDSGVDSASSIRISRDIEVQLALDDTTRLSRAVVFEYPTVAALADHLVENVTSQLEAHLGHRAPVIEEPAKAEPVATVSSDAYRPDDIAIIGMAGEFPGSADAETFWQALRHGEDAVRVIPTDRWEWRDDYALAPDEPGGVQGRHGGFVEHALDFDPVFFTITPAEAERMDPQERRFLQASYHALEDSGHFAAPTRDVGVFVAAMYGHYQDLTAPETVNSSFAAIANRVSYTFDLHGPSVALDSMCSGALTALHLAASAIRAGDCAVAVAGGVNVMAHPGKYRLLSEGKFLSPTGRCHAFGVAADGYVPGEGAGAVVLKSVGDALRDGDRIHAVIRATAVNSGGRTAGFTVPSERAQHRVIAAALSRAEIDPGAVTYVEAHGTGTQLGDPIEVNALRRAYGGPEHGVAYLGAVKSNIGHLESAAAMAGLVKIVKQLGDRTLAPTLHCELENPHLNLDGSRFALVKEPRSWPTGTGPARFAGLSSFGAGGANGHAIIQEFMPPATRPLPEFRRYFIPLSGRDEAALRRRKDDLLAAVRARPDVSLYGLSYTLCQARQHFRVRTGYWVESADQLIEQLQTRTATQPSGDDAMAAYLAGDTPDFASLFPVRALVDAPLYPFATERYLASSLDAATTPTERAPDALLVAPVWRPDAAEPGERPVHTVLALTDREQDLPAPPDDIRLIRVVPGETLAIGADRIELPDGDDAAARRVFAHLTDELGLDHLHWVTVRRKWTVAAILSFAKALQACRTPSTIVAATDERATAETAVPIGFFHGLAEENPHIRAIHLRHGRLDWAPLLAELGAAQMPFTDVTWTDGTRRSRGLGEVRLTGGARLRTGGTYLITGGLGKVGRAIAERLVDRYQATVITVGRSTPDAAWLATRDGLHHERADVTDAAQTSDLIARVRARFGTLTGVIHSAGVVADALVPNKSIEDVRSVLAPKVAGARNLDECTSAEPLDFFCVFSSVSSVLGNVGQSDYIAANRFLDEFAAERSRRKASGFTLSVNWPLWLDEEDERREQYEALAGYLREEFGMAPLTSRDGANLFLDLLDGVPDDCHQVLACVGDVPRLRQRLVQPIEVAPQVVPAPTVPTADIGDRLETLVRAQTGLRGEDVAVDATWGDLGYSSVMLQQLAGRLGAEFGVDTPPNALFKYRSIALLSDYLREHGATVAEDADPVPRPESGRGEYAVVGMSGILPGGRDLAEFWDLLVENRSAIRPVERWQDRGGPYFAGAIDDYAAFDNAFFGLSAREAQLMDPQHRLFLQAAYNALLDAGYAPSGLRDVGVFAGVQFSEYQSALSSADDRAHPYAVTGNAHTMLANRVSHLLDFTGPSQTVDTACSSGLVALNRGVLSLAAGECDVAIVGAVSVLVDPAATDAATGLNVLSPDYRCATFDKDANGYVRAEGVGCVAVKRLADARRDGDSVHAVIEAVAENHGGRANSLTAPNPDAQVALLEKAYTPDLAARVTAIETHGTGTKLGDPIEVGALRTAFDRLAPHREPGSIALGAVKTNVGHLEPAAGMAGLLKMLLCLKHRTLPANLNFRELNPLVEVADSPFRLLLENEGWKDSGPLVAGISSFGFGGSNAHVVLSEAPREAPTAHPPRAQWLVPLSARSPRSLAAMRDALLTWLRGAEADLGDIAYTLATGRDHFEYRLGWLATSTADLRAQVEAAQPAEVIRCDRDRGTAQASQDTGDAVLARFLAGAEPDWPAMFSGGEYRRLTMPGYVFEPNSFWLE